MGLTTFMNNCLPEYGQLLRIRNPSTITEASRLALNEEIAINLKKMSLGQFRCFKSTYAFETRKNLFCSFCKKKGHTKEKCFKLNLNKKGHSIERCYQRKQGFPIMMKRGWDNNSSGSKNSQHDSKNENAARNAKIQRASGTSDVSKNYNSSKNGKNLEKREINCVKSESPMRDYPL